MSDDGGALEGNPSRYVAQYDFSDPQEGELAFKAGDELLALPIPDVTDWLFAKHGTEFGKIPANFVQIMPESAAPSPSMRQFSNDDNNELVRMHAVVSPKSGASTRRSPGVDGGRGSVSPRNRGESSSADRSPVHGGRQSEEGADDQLHETNNDHRAGKEDIVSPRTRAAVTAVAKKRSQRFAALSVSPPTGAAATGKKQDSHAKDTVQFELPPGPLGIRVSPFGANIAVECVTPGSSGDNIGLQQHDLIVAINDQNLSGLPKERAMALFASFQNEEKRTLVVSRKSSSKGSRRSARHSRLKRVSSSISMQKPLDSRSAPQSQLQQLPGESLLEQIERVVYVNPFTAPVSLQLWLARVLLHRRMQSSPLDDLLLSVCRCRPTRMALSPSPPIKYAFSVCDLDSCPGICSVFPMATSISSNSSRRKEALRSTFSSLARTCEGCASNSRGTATQAKSST